MYKFIAILRGINVGGKRKLPMAELRALFAEIGYEDIQTYIQSGNVIFSTQEIHLESIAQSISEKIKERFEYDVPVIVRTIEEWKEVISLNSFLKTEDTDIEKLHLTFLAETPDSDHLEKIKSYDYSPDQFKIIGKHVFLSCEIPYHKTKLTNNFFESKLKVSATTRNWKTVLKLAELAGA